MEKNAPVEVFIAQLKSLKHMMYDRTNGKLLPLTKVKTRGLTDVRELTILLENDKKRPLYEQIYADIRAKVRSGDIPSGERLPSARALAGHLQVSRSTVDLAYARLQDEGYIVPVPCKGFFVCDVETLYELPMEEEIASVPDEESQRSAWRYDFSVNGIDEQGFPFAIWNRLTKTALLDTEQHMFVQGQARGEAGLREVLRGYLHYARGVECSAAQIVIGAGNDYLLFLLSVMMGHAHTIAMEDPTYMSARRCFETLGYSVCSVGLDDAGIRVDELAESGADIAYVMPSHQFPTGIVTSIGRRYELLGWASAKGNRYLVEDDYDCEFRLTGRPIPSLQSIDATGKVIYANTFTKSLGPAFRIGYLVLPPALADRFRRELGFYSCTVSAIDQLALARFIESGDYERHVNRLRTHYRSVRDALVSAFQTSSFSERVSIEEQDAGIHFIMGISTDIKTPEVRNSALQGHAMRYRFDDVAAENANDCHQPAGPAAESRWEREFVDAAQGRGVRIVPLSLFYSKSAATERGPVRRFLVSYGGIELDSVELAVAALEYAVRAADEATR